MSCAQEEKKKKGKKKKAESLESVTGPVLGAHHATEPLPVPALATDLWGVSMTARVKIRVTCGSAVLRGTSVGLRC
jgi:hypothetical protein